MKADIRWQLLLAAICAGLVVSLLGFQVQTAGLCTTIVPATGEWLVEGMIGQPRYLNPLLSDQNPVDAYLADLIFDGLTRYDASGRLEPALARSWAFSEDGQTVTFQLRDDARWHDGEAVTAADVAFTYGLLRDPDIPAAPQAKQLWQSVTITQTGELEIAFALPQPYGPFLESTTRGLLPAHILQDVPVDELLSHSFNRAPVGTGPFIVSPGSDWRRTGRLRLAPNPLAWRGGVRLDGVEYRFYPDALSLAEAFGSGEIQAVSRFPEGGFSRLARLDGMRLFTSGTDMYTQLIFNLDPETASPVRSLRVRQALAYGLDREQLIDQTLNGQGLPLEGPYLPTTWAFDPALMARYSPQPARADELLNEAGWSLASGGAVRQDADGGELALRLLTSTDDGHAALAAGMAAQLAELAVSLVVRLVAPEALPTELALRQFDLALVDVAPARDPDLYDLWSQEAIVRGQNFGAWNNRAASEALEAARRLSTIDERQIYYQAFLRFFDQDLPALTVYQHVQSYGISAAVNEVEVGPTLTSRERYNSLAEWFLRYREVAMNCPPGHPQG